MENRARLAWSADTCRVTTWKIMLQMSQNLFGGSSLSSSRHLHILCITKHHLRTIKTRSEQARLTGVQFDEWTDLEQILGLLLLYRYGQYKLPGSISGFHQRQMHKRIVKFAIVMRGWCVPTTKARAYNTQKGSRSNINTTKDPTLQTDASFQVTPH